MRLVLKTQGASRGAWFLRAPIGDASALPSFVLFRRPYGLLGHSRSLEHGDGQQPRHARRHLHRPAEDAQSATHGDEDGISQLILRWLWLALRHRLILTRSQACRCSHVEPPSMPKQQEDLLDNTT